MTRRTVKTARAVAGEPEARERAPWGRPLVSELLESIPDPVIGCDATGRVVYWSRAAREAYGYSGEEALGRPVVKLLRTRFPAPLLEIMELVTDVGHWQGRLTHRTRDGREVEVESRWVARYDDEGRLAGGFGIERAAEAAGPAQTPPPSLIPGAARSEIEESTRRLAGGVVHDFNNALAIIINYAAFVGSEVERLRTAPTESQRASMRDDLEQISTAAERAAQLTARLLAFARQRSGSPGPVDLDQAIREITDVLQRTVGDHVAVTLELAGGDHRVRGDTVRIQQTIVDLAVAARDAMPDGGRVTIQTRAISRDSDGKAGRWVRVRVAGSGSTFDASFELAVNEHSPDESRSDGGPGIGANGASDGQATARATILLVEDEHPLRQLCRRILSQAGYHVLDASDGPEALRIAAAHDGEIHLLLTDIVMPGMLGHHLAQRLRSLRPSTAVAYMSGFSDAVLNPRTRLREALIDKPFTAPALLEHVRWALRAAPDRT
ncbi:MAG: ATP-binding response regulator [Solirubrobacteraceae bacterium]